MGSSPVLPVELLQEVAAVCSRGDQLNLAASSRVFHCATRLIYRDISLTDAKAAVLCSRTLARNHSLAQLVQSLHIAFPLNDFAFISFMSLLNNALLNLSNLEALTIYLGTKWSTILSRCSFPRLYRFSSHFQLDQEISQFLSRHPVIQHLQLSDTSTTPSEIAMDSFHFPHLRHLVANSAWFGPLSRSARLRSAFVTFNVPDINGTISELDISSGHSLNVLGCQRDGWNLDLLDLISTRFPGILSLSLINQPSPEEDGTEVPAEAVQSLLSRFPYLVRLFFRTRLPLQHSYAQLDDEYSVVLQWFSACPSLQKCALPSNLEWDKTASNHWVPDLSQTQDTRTLNWVLTRITDQTQHAWAQGVSSHILNSLEKYLATEREVPPQRQALIALVRKAALAFATPPPTPLPSKYSDMPPLI
ncbi:hypothetical protein DL96DRAFT_1709754 [Flagelloscypha sp. PMI_526]|nr:hypothetical protein DL96DRAFT_1709754 [Flagelloscypha sp. PMI_526]